MIGKLALPIAAGGTGGGGGGTITTTLREYTSSTTWTKPANLYAVEVICINGGESGEYGERDLTSAATGGDGGQGGLCSYDFLLESELGSTVTITIGAGGAAQPGVTTDDRPDGNNAGGSSSFGSYTYNNAFSKKGSLGSANNRGESTEDGQGGRTSSYSAWNLVTRGGCGGGGGGSRYATAPTNGGEGGRYRLASGSYSSVISGGTPATNGTATDGADGADDVDDKNTLSAGMLAKSPTNLPGVGGGGGGGAYSDGTADAFGGNGGDGGFPGGGGGGGGGVEWETGGGGSISGAGGAGGDGAVYVLEYVLS